MARERIVLGGGSRSWKVVADADDPAVRCPALEVVDGLATEPRPAEWTAPVVSLRPVEDADLPIFLAHQDDPVAAAMAAFPTRAPEAFYEHWATIRADPSDITRTIVADGVVAGDIVSWIAGDHREVGYWIGREYWGRGYRDGRAAAPARRGADRPIVAHIVPRQHRLATGRGALRVRPCRRGRRG